MTTEQLLTLEHWLFHIIPMTGLGLATLIWAILTGQFSEPDRACRLALLSEERWRRMGRHCDAEVVKPCVRRRPTGLIALTVIGIIGVSLSIATALWSLRVPSRRKETGGIRKLRKLSLVISQSPNFAISQFPKVRWNDEPTDCFLSLAH